MKSYAEIGVGPFLWWRAVLRIHQDCYDDGAGMDFGFLACAAQFLPTMTASFILELLNVSALDDYVSIGSLDGMQSTLAVEIFRVSGREIVHNPFCVIAALGGLNGNNHFIPF